MKPTLLLLVLAATAHAKTLKVEAGEHDRANTVVTVPTPDDVPENPGLKSADGKILPLRTPTGDMEIAHDKAYRSEYRIVLFDGSPDKQLLDRLWNDYATPPTAAWE